MDFGILLLFANSGSSISDEELWKGEVALGPFAEELGYDSIWAPEHHFDKPYCMSPDGLQALTYIAAQTSKIKLGTGGIILPWHKEPLRLAERIQMLDCLSEGRLLLGFGRGLARIEYEGFGIDMETSRERFDESAEMILQGLETGIMEYDGKHFQQPRVEIHPRSGRSFRDRLYTIAMSPPSLLAAAEFGGTLMCFNFQHPIEQQAEEFEKWRVRYREVHEEEPPPPVLLDYFYCHEDGDVARETMHKHLSRFYNSLVDHYEFDGKHFGNTRNYESYQTGADMLREVGREAAHQGFYDMQLKGSPDEIKAEIRKRRELIGEYQQMVLVSYGGMTYPTIRDSLKLFAEKVMPEFKTADQPTLAPTS
jgi:alkanesulfonate monooxygenase SsuD/methylene tetrahydromethanopterin reductase-like flavin-dependent oxidoreductase (luciferase family)